MGKTHPVIGLALGSGGANGLAHIGVLKMLEKHGIPVHCIAGSSIGALIGALYAAHGHSQVLEDIAIQASTKKQIQFVDPTLNAGILKGEKIANIIHEFLQGATFENLSVPFAAVATDFNTGETVIIRDGNLIQSVRASIAVPAILQPVIYNSRLLADGGLSEPVPVEAARAMGADIVIAVNLDALPPSGNSPALPSLSSIPWRSINILRHHLAYESAKTADFVITPKIMQKTLIGWNSFFNENKIRELINAGTEATEHALPQIRQSVYSSQSRYRQLCRAIPFLHKLR